jgi:cysteine desulfurase
VTPLLRGATQERGLRAGTENVPSIVGFGQACELARRDLDAEATRQRALRDQLWIGLSAAIPGLRRNSHPTECLPNTLNVSFPDVQGSRLLAATPEIAASTGSACHAGEETPSAVLLAMGIEPRVALGAVRLSIGRSTSAAQIAVATRALADAYEWLR